MWWKAHEGYGKYYEQKNQAEARLEEEITKNERSIKEQEKRV